LQGKIVYLTQSHNRKSLIILRVSRSILIPVTSCTQYSCITFAGTHGWPPKCYCRWPHWQLFACSSIFQNPPTWRRS